MKKYLIRLGEISLKGLNRTSFQARLCNNIKEKLLPHHVKIQSQKGRLFLYTEDDVPRDLVFRVLNTTFGLDGYSECHSTEDKTVDGLFALVDKVISDNFDDGITTFKVDARREDKRFPLSSYQIECQIGGKILEKYPKLKVDVKKPERVLYVEIRKDIFVYSSRIKGRRGLPVGTAGKGLSLLSGGIDSPVSSYLIASRGVKLELLYFHAYPYTTDEAKEKVISLARTIAPYLQGTVLHIVSFTELEKVIAKNGYENEKTLMLRAGMVKAAEKLAKIRRCECIVTGEALSQVASQTLKALDFTSSLTTYNILRPLVGLDKAEIIERAKEIGTYETSILPYADCCVLFSPKHPKTKPQKDKLTKGYEALNLDDVIEKAVNEREVVYIKPECC